MSQHEKRHKLYWATNDPYENPEYKYCSGCNVDLPRINFVIDKNKRDGLYYLCRKCSHKAIMKTSRSFNMKHWTNNDPYKDESLKYCSSCKMNLNRREFSLRRSNKDGLRSKCKTCINTDSRKKYNKGSHRSNHIKRVFDMSIEDYNQLLAQQNYVCAICLKIETRIINGEISSLVIDHSHIDNRIRGLLCQKCNSGLGMINDNIELLKRAILYLRGDL